MIDLRVVVLMSSYNFSFKLQLVFLVGIYGSWVIYGSDIKIAELARIIAK